MAPSEREKKAFASSLGPNAAAAGQSEVPERVAPQVFEVPEEVLNRESLLDTRAAQRLRTGKPQAISRVLLVGRYSVAPEALTEAARAFFDGRRDTDTFSGAILYYDGATYSSVVLMVLEASTTGLGAFLTSAVMEQLEASRVLGFSDDLGARAWPVFATASVKANSSSTELMEASAVHAALAGTALNCARLGRSLRELAAKEGEPERISSHLAAATELQPPALLLLSALDTEALFSVERYVALYVSPVRLQLPSEQVWPSQEFRLTY
jgi:hypothetical protein